ncbi:hypothetical protein EON65_22995 [archaeon]|nr:MAG: hypothetical protein EON65_22995 [archaeon]
MSKATRNIEDLVTMEAMLRELVTRQEENAISSSSMSHTSYPQHMQESYMMLPSYYASPPPPSQSPSYMGNHFPASNAMNTSTISSASVSSTPISLLQYFWGTGSGGSSGSNNPRPASTHAASGMNSYSIQAIEQNTWGEGGGEIMGAPVRVRQTSQGSESGLEASDPYMVIKRLSKYTNSFVIHYVWLLYE